MKKVTGLGEEGWWFDQEGLLEVVGNIFEQRPQ